VHEVFVTYFKVISQQLPGGAEEDHVIPIGIISDPDEIQIWNITYRSKLL
jgi:hypothetical protein